MNTTTSSGTIARTIILALALINQILSASGHSVLPISDAEVESLVTVSWTILSALLAWWKNNSFTCAAKLGDVAMQDARSKAASTLAAKQTRESLGTDDSPNPGV